MATSNSVTREIAFVRIKDAAETVLTREINHPPVHVAYGIKPEGIEIKVRMNSYEHRRLCSWIDLEALVINPLIFWADQMIDELAKKYEEERAQMEQARREELEKYVPRI